MSAQELNLLLELLSNGNIPDKVIFYDGCNDGYAGVYSPAKPRWTEVINFVNRADSLIQFIYNKSNYKRIYDFFNRRLIGTKYWDKKIEPDIENNSREVIRDYIEFTEQVKAIAKIYGFEAYFFWQPNLLSLTRKMQDYENKLLKDCSWTMIMAMKSVYLEAKKSFEGDKIKDVHFIADVLDYSQEPIYIGWCHLGPQRNRIIAQTIYKKLFSLEKD